MRRFRSSSRCWRVARTLLCELVAPKLTIDFGIKQLLAWLDRLISLTVVARCRGVHRMLSYTALHGMHVLRVRRDDEWCALMLRVLHTIYTRFVLDAEAFVKQDALFGACTVHYVPYRVASAGHAALTRASCWADQARRCTWHSCARP